MATDAYVESLRLRIAGLASDLKKRPAAVGSAADRIRRAREENAIRHALVDVLAELTATLLVSGRVKESVTVARDCLRHATAVFGEGSLQAVPAYLLLAEAHVANGKLVDAEEVLSLANWAVVRADDPSHELQARLHRGFGKLLAAKSDHQAALRAYAEDVYESSQAAGPESVLCASAFFGMGDSFDALGQAESALALWDKAVECWSRQINEAREAGAAAAPDVPPAARQPDLSSMPRPVLLRAVDQLESVAENRAQHLGPSHLAVAEAYSVLGLLLWAGDDLEAARAHLDHATGILEQQLGPDNPDTIAAKESLQALAVAAEAQAPGP